MLARPHDDSYTPNGSSDRRFTERGIAMRWTKPKAEVVAVTLEVTAYVATL
jgi:hypothetical protein